MAPEISKIDPDHHQDVGGAVWKFYDEVLRCLFHGNSLSDPEGPAQPIYRQFS
jgi:hypothetical protein